MSTRKERWKTLSEIVRYGFRSTSLGLQDAEIARFMLQEAMADKRRLILKAEAGRGGAKPHISAGKMRFAKSKARALKRKILRNRRRPLNLNALTRSRTPSPLLDSLDVQRPTRWKRLIARRFKKVFPRLSLIHLNFIDSPIETMGELIALSRLDSEEINAFLDFDDDFCHDIGVYLVIAEIWPQLSKIFRGGRMPPPVQKVLDAVGLRKDLGISLTHARNHANIWPFEMRRRRTRGTTMAADAQLHPQGREQLNDRLIELIDEWLSVASAQTAEEADVVWELTGEGKANLANMVGEILDNAERHSTGDGDGDWTMAAFMAKREEGDAPAQMRCYLAFLSVGASIAETIAHAPTVPRDFCFRYARAHARAGQSIDTLVTIAALQDGVTSSHAAVSGRRGGTGLQDTLAFIGELGGSPQAGADVRATIVSGRSCVRLRSPMLVGSPDGHGRRVQWCNALNDPLYPPDRDAAFDLPAHFAGTLVSIALTLDPRTFIPEGDVDGNNND